jgi:hypothetical protein
MNDGKRSKEEEEKEEKREPGIHGLFEYLRIAAAAEGVGGCGGWLRLIRKASEKPAEREKVRGPQKKGEEREREETGFFRPNEEWFGY